MANAPAILEETNSFAAPRTAELAALARTFGGAPHPVWVHDTCDRCLYVNQAARHLNGHHITATRHEILDHENQTVARLTVGQHPLPVRIQC